MRRRDFIIAICGAVADPLGARAQQPKRIPVIGVLWHAANRQGEVQFFDWVREGFSQAGFVEG